MYAETKLAAEGELGLVAAAFGVPFQIARVFGLVGPRQARNYVLPGLIARAANGRLDQIPGLDYARDYLDARDVCVDLMLLARASPVFGSHIVNVCSGVPVTIREVLGTVLRQMHPARAEALISKATAAPGRASDVQWLVGDPTRFTVITGAPPQRIALATTVSDALADRA